MDSPSGRDLERTPAPDNGYLRKCRDWIDTFLEYTRDYPSPVIFRKWAAICTIAGACERRIWTHTFSENRFLYPNLYVSLIGAPGSGKTIAIDETKAMWRAVPNLKIAPDTVTRASFIDAMSEAKRLVTIAGRPTEYHSLLLPADELSALIPEYEMGLISILTKFYDNPNDFEERLRTRKEQLLRIIRPQLNFIAGAQPKYLATVMPEVAWEQGFLARNILVYSPTKFTRDMFAPERTSNFTWIQLNEDLKHISRLQGRFIWSPEAQKAMGEWHLSGGNPVPNHPKLEHYNSRRTTLHMPKLCMVATLSKSSALTITLEAFELAKQWLLEAEATTPGIFREMGMGGDASIMWDCWNYAMEESKKSPKGTIREDQLVRFLVSRIDSTSVMRSLETMESAGLIQKTGPSTQPGNALYKPLPKKDPA